MTAQATVREDKAAYPPNTRVKILAGSHRGKEGVVGSAKPNYRNSGKVEILVGHQNKSVWCKPEWLKQYDAPGQRPHTELHLEAEIPAPWRSPAEFTITLSEGRTVEVKFTPCLEGEQRMHQFNLTGPVSPTGFQSHFVLASELEGVWPTPVDYAQAYTEALVAGKALEQHKPRTGNRSRSLGTSQTPIIEEHASPNTDALSDLSFDDSLSRVAFPQSRSEPTVQLDSTLVPVTSEPALLNPVHDAGSVPPSSVEVLDPLTPEEESERHRLELKVERAFYEAGVALLKLRDLRLYRSTHNTFEQYCRERFGFTHRHVNYLIAGSQVVENLQVRAHSQTENSQMGTNGSQILPTSERQVRPLTTLGADEQRKVWQQAVEEAGGKVPSGSIVKGIVKRLKEKTATPPSPDYLEGDVVEIRAGANSTLRRFDGYWGIVTHVGSWSYTVHISVREVDLQCKGDELVMVDKKYTADIQAIAKRIKFLVQRDDLSRTAIAKLGVAQFSNPPDRRCQALAKVF